MEYSVKDVGVVVLNYLNYQDTIECVESILSQKELPGNITIVDNCSYNESYEILADRFSKNPIVDLVKTKKNLGFAKGNNLGINNVIKFHKLNFALVVNNDTVFTDPDFISKMIAGYKDGIGVIGPVIRTPSKVQAEFNVPLSFKNCLFAYLNFWSAKKGSSFDLPLDLTKKRMVLHGCCLMLTPSYFRYYKNLFPLTFLFSEEQILFLRCCRKNLKEVYLSSVEIYHKEDGASELSFGNENSMKMKFFAQSKKYVLLHLLITPKAKIDCGYVKGE